MLTLQCVIFLPQVNLFENRQVKECMQPFNRIFDRCLLLKNNESV